MILDKSVEIRWHPKNKKYFIDKGYEFTKMNNSFIINICDLNITSNTNITVKCDVCSNVKHLKYYQYLKNIKNGGYYGCTRKCSNDKAIKTNLEKYGCEHPLQFEKFMKKSIETNIKKFGVVHHLKLKSQMEKLKQTNVERYGVECILQNDNIIKKYREKNIKNFGVEFASQNKEIKEKVKQSNIAKFGVEYCSQSPEIQIKTANTNMERYGCKNPLQNHEISEKTKKTNMRKYGCENPSQNLDVKNKRKNTLISRYGFEHISLVKEFTDKALKSIIDKYGEIWAKHVPRYNPNSIIYLDMISEKLNTPIQHALNGGEKKFIKYWADGYITEYNICLEWDEEHHKNTKSIINDTKKEIFLKENFNCNIIRINEKEFLKDIDSQIEIVCNNINNIITNGKSI